MKNGCTDGQTPYSHNAPHQQLKSDDIMLSVGRIHSTAPSDRWSSWPGALAALYHTPLSHYTNMTGFWQLLITYAATSLTLAECNHSFTHSLAAVCVKYEISGGARHLREGEGVPNSVIYVKHNKFGLYHNVADLLHNANNKLFTPCFPFPPIFSARQRYAYCLSSYMLSPVRLPVRLSVYQTDGSYKNGWS